MNIKSPQEILEYNYNFSDETYRKIINIDNKLSSFYNRDEINIDELTIIELLLGKYEGNSNKYFSLLEKLCNKMKIGVLELDDRDIINLMLFFKFLEIYCHLNSVSEKDKNEYIDFIENSINKIKEEYENVSTKDSFFIVSIIIVSFLDYAYNEFSYIVNNNFTCKELFSDLDKSLNEFLNNKPLNTFSRDSTKLHDIYMIFIYNSYIGLSRDNDNIVISKEVIAYNEDKSEADTFNYLKSQIDALKALNMEQFLKDCQKLFYIWDAQDREK